MSFRDWPRSATWDATGYYELPTQEPPTAGSAFSSSPGLLPMPAASSFNDGESAESWQARNERLRALGINGNGMDTPLAIAVQLLKTPTAQLAVNGGSQPPGKRRAGGHGPTLADQVEHELLPTPAARDWKSGQSNLIGTNARPLNEIVEMTLMPAPRATDGTKGGPNQRGSSGDLMLPSAVMNLLPTPRATDWKDSVNKHGERTPPEVAARRGRALSEEARLLPTPTAMDSRGSRNATAARRPDSTGHPGTTLTDVFWTGDLTDPPSPGGSGC